MTRQAADDPDRPQKLRPSATIGVSREMPPRADAAESGGSCCAGVDRREFLKTAGLGLVTLSSLGVGAQAMAGPFFGNPGEFDHFIPADKRLTKEWLRSLYEAGVTRVLRGRELNLVGMPVGGLAAGQVYICGDGTLGEWKIFNQQYFSGYGKDNYRPRMPDKTIDQGFAVVVDDGKRLRTRRLDRGGFPAVEFVGQYPIANVRYVNEDFPVHAELEAFSPFIPLNARDSALPATVLRLMIENASASPLRVRVVGWLENAVCFHNTRERKLPVQHRSRIVTGKGRALLVHTAEPLPREPAERDDILLADFEGGSYGGWTVEGEAFGDKPAAGTLPNQQPVTGFVGEGLVNTFKDGDAPHGKLTSPKFPVSRKYINFLIGGGKHPKETCVNLLIDGEIVRTATGEDSERLMWHSWDVQEFDGRLAQIEIVDAHSGSWGHINVDQVELSDQQRFGMAGPIDKLDDYGSMVLALGERAASPEETKALLNAVSLFEDDWLSEADAAYPSSERRKATLATPTVELAPGARRTFDFVLAWHFPNRAEGNMYANWFEGAADVAQYVFDNFERLRGETHLWHDTFYDSTLPHWLLDRLHSTVCNLATGTCLWWGNGRVWCWEGVGCCSGTCTHVWNYAHAMARLFPEMERSVREMQDLGAALHDDGLVGFRGLKNEWYAADGQCGTVLKCYREHQMSADDSFLKRNWPSIKKVLEYSIRHDANDDGLIEDSQHNTYDINFHGANTFVGSLYLAALRAGEEMAREVGDAEFAAHVRQIFESGSRLTVERLWNGEYFIQDVDLDQHPQYQYGQGCLSDQLFGQGWAHQLGLGYLYPEEHVKKTLQSVWKYNWTPDVGPQNAVYTPERWFAYPGDAGLFTCTWPKTKHLDKDGVRYRNEVWTGIEYQVAGHMIWEGMVEEALAICRGVHDRYDPLRHNPFNEVECGDHYARALASWGVYTALCGYEYHGPKGHLGFAPRLTPESFRAAFTAAEGWGTFLQTRDERSQHDRIQLRWGKLRLRSLALAAPTSIDRGTVTVRVGDRMLENLELRGEGERLVVRLGEDLTLSAGDVLEVAIG
jgi:non-lysosomal glucosylceramidase